MGVPVDGCARARASDTTVRILDGSVAFPLKRTGRLYSGALVRPIHARRRFPADHSHETVAHQANPEVYGQSPIDLVWLVLRPSRQGPLHEVLTLQQALPADLVAAIQMENKRE